MNLASREGLNYKIRGACVAAKVNRIGVHGRNIYERQSSLNPSWNYRSYICLETVLQNKLIQDIQVYIYTLYIYTLLFFCIVGVLVAFKKAWMEVHCALLKSWMVFPKNSS